MGAVEYAGTAGAAILEKVAVEFEDVAAPGPLMEPIDVLRHEREAG